MSTDQKQLCLTREEKDFIQSKIDKVNQLEELIKQNKIDQNYAVKEIDQLLEEVAQITDRALEHSSNDDSQLQAEELTVIKSTQSLSSSHLDLISQIKQNAIQKNLQFPVDSDSAYTRNLAQAEKEDAWNELFKEDPVILEKPITPKNKIKTKKFKTSKRSATRAKRNLKRKSSFIKNCFIFLLLGSVSILAYANFFDESELLEKLRLNIPERLKSNTSDSIENIPIPSTQLATPQYETSKQKNNNNEPLLNELQLIDSKLKSINLSKQQRKKLQKIKNELEGIIAIRKNMSPYRGHKNSEIDNQNLHGKIMCGYQGWFTAEGDGSANEWAHYKAGKELKPGNITIDLWPDMSVMDKDERYPTPFKHADGSTAYLFSSYNSKTVDRHFQWMKEHNIDGVFLQRFGVNLKRSESYKHRNVIGRHVQSAAHKHDRTWAIMYDLTGFKAGDIKKYLIPDWMALVDKVKLSEDMSYLHHNKKPLIAIWGVGFSDDRQYSLEETEELITFLKNDPIYGGNTVMIGTPSFWRDQKRDATKHPRLHEVFAKADIISPWTPGRYKTLSEVKSHAQKVIQPDVEWCNNKGLELYPVIFPGFSWQNLMRAKGQDAPLNHIPRLKGQFLWSQATEYKKAGAEMLYVAMFDEVDEATAIMKCTNNPPIGKSKFSDYEGLPSDHYLKLCGEIRKMLNSNSNPQQKIPSSLFQ